MVEGEEGRVPLDGVHQQGLVPIHKIGFMHQVKVLFIRVQCDQIGQISKVLGYKFTSKSSPNIWQYSMQL